MLLVQLDPNSRLPKFRQIIDAIKRLIDSTALPAGYRLPSSRVLSEKLGVNRSTVYRAYQELWARGYIDCKPGTYTTVRYRNHTATQSTEKSPSLVDWNRVSSERGNAMHRQFLQQSASLPISDWIDFVPLSPDPRLYPVDAYRKCQNHVMRTIGAPLLQYGDSMGYWPLRDFIARRMQTHGMNLDPEEVIITNGVQQALNLILQLLVKPDSCLVIEEPTYSAVLPLLRLYGAEVVGIPMNCDGLDLSRLEDVIAEKKPDLLYTMPNFQNPTGITTSHAHREQLITLCQRAGVLIIEDGFEEELKYFGKAVLPLKSMDRSGIVLYLGTFSKVLFPGLRVGWIAADRNCIQRLNALKHANDTAGNTMEQAALNYYCRCGDYELHVKRMHREYRKRMKSALAAAKQYIPTRFFSYTIPAGGYTFWIKANRPEISEQSIMTATRTAGINVSPGSKYFIRQVKQAHFRISIAHCNENEIEKGFRRLSSALLTLIKKNL